MVFFTCNNCGESLKKPMVEKHYNVHKCRNFAYNLTCVDCLKDFGEDFKEHTKCISELEKYSAKGFVSKPDSNKGAQKQEAWTEIIQAHLQKRTDLDAYTRKTMEHLAQQTNVPRKKAKFVNFVSNCMRMSPNNAEALWKVAEQALEEFKAKDQEAKNAQAAKQKAEKEAREAAKAAAEPTEKKTKKDKKRKAEEAPAAEENEDVKPAKKSKKNKKQDSEVSSTTDVVAVAPESAADIKKAKKKQRKAAAAALAAADSSVAPTFEWKKVITEVLQKKDEIKVAKLKSKVLKRLADFNNDGAETTPKDEKKFQKHLDQMAKFVHIENEKAKLIASV